MSDMQLFRGLSRMIPLEPIGDAEAYFKACDLQEEYKDSEDKAIKLYLAALTIFVTEYENGYRVD